MPRSCIIEILATYVIVDQRPQQPRYIPRFERFYLRWFSVFPSLFHLSFFSFWGLFSHLPCCAAQILDVISGSDDSIFLSRGVAKEYSIFCSNRWFEIFRLLILCWNIYRPILSNIATSDFGRWNQSFLICKRCSFCSYRWFQKFCLLISCPDKWLWLFHLFMPTIEYNLEYSLYLLLSNSSGVQCCKDYLIFVAICDLKCSSI